MGNDLSKDSTKRRTDSKAPDDQRSPYLSLNISDVEIRLCTIVPGIPASPISCTLETTRLYGAKDYKCLSYVWGIPKPAHPNISLNGATQQVTENLYAALESLRRNEVTSPLWIDALCINQNNKDEKDQQVPLMADIFSGAQEVFDMVGR